MHTKSTVLCTLTFLASAGIVLSIGLPRLLDRHAQATAVATTVDAQDFDQLFQDLAKLQTKAGGLGAVDFKLRAIDRTAEYLDLPPDARIRFAQAVDRALGEIDDARTDLRKANARAIELEAPQQARLRRENQETWQAEARRASDRLLSVLDPEPRHRLLAEKRLEWLMRVDHSVRAGS